MVSLATNKSLLPTVPYDVDKDLTLISNTLRLSNLMIVNNALPVKTVPELIAYAKKNPGKLAFGSDGNGTTAHLGVELFKAMTGTHMLHVPYRAATSAVTDLIGGGLQLMMINTPVSGPLAQAGKVRALGISSPQRSPTYPDVPTIAESGCRASRSRPGAASSARPTCPRTSSAGSTPKFARRWRAPPCASASRRWVRTPRPSTPEEFLELSRRETVKWARIVKFSGARID